MDGLSLDMKKIANEASSFLNRARQFTEEQLGQVETTRLDEDVELLLNQFDVNYETVTKIKSSIEEFLQPNPNLRYEKMILSKIDANNTLGRPMESEFLAFGKTMIDYGKLQKPHNEKLSGILSAIGQAQNEIAKSEETYISNAHKLVLQPLDSFLKNDAKTILKEKKSLETYRFDLDVAKAKLKKVKTLEMRNQVENEVTATQAEFMRQQEVLKLLLENTSSSKVAQIRAMVDFVDNQASYLAAAASNAKALQAKISDITSDLPTMSSFPRKNSDHNVTVNDILKDTQ